MQTLMYAIEQEIKFVNDSETAASDYTIGYARALEVVLEFLDITAGKPRADERLASSAAGRLLSSILLQQELASRYRADEVDEIEKKTELQMNSQLNTHVFRKRDVTIAIESIDPSERITILERKALVTALRVLRSDADYGDFLNWWLQQYGRRVLTATPSAPLLGALTIEDELSLTAEDAYAN